jgi:hypothetical protein
MLGVPVETHAGIQVIFPLFLSISDKNKTEFHDNLIGGS